MVLIMVADGLSCKTMYDDDDDDGWMHAGGLSISFRRTVIINS